MFVLACYGHADVLCTAAQRDFWSAALRLIGGTAKDQLGQLRRTLQRGLDVVRIARNRLHFSIGERGSGPRPPPQVALLSSGWQLGDFT